MKIIMVINFLSKILTDALHEKLNEKKTKLSFELQRPEYSHTRHFFTIKRLTAAHKTGFPFTHYPTGDVYNSMAMPKVTHPTYPAVFI